MDGKLEYEISRGSLTGYEEVCFSFTHGDGVEDAAIKGDKYLTLEG